VEAVGELAAAEGIVLHELRRSGATLEEAFLRLTGGSEQGVAGLKPPSTGGTP
jgi:ABC-2 type transport system ATP-binding protein